MDKFEIIYHYSHVMRAVYAEDDQIAREHVAPGDLVTHPVQPCRGYGKGYIEPFIDVVHEPAAIKGIRTFGRVPVRFAEEGYRVPDKVISHLRALA